MSAPKKTKQKEPEPDPESKRKKDKKEQEKEGAQDKEEPPKKGKVPAPKVRLRGTCVPAFCNPLFPVVPDVPVPGYTCTRVLYPLVPPCPHCHCFCTAPPLQVCRFATVELAKSGGASTGCTQAQTTLSPFFFFVFCSSGGGSTCSTSSQMIS